MKYYHSIILHSGQYSVPIEDFISRNPFGKTALKRLKLMGKLLGLKRETYGMPAKYRYRNIANNQILELH
jgi:hypothetical protein